MQTCILRCSVKGRQAGRPNPTVIRNSIGI